MTPYLIKREDNTFVVQFYSNKPRSAVATIPNSFSKDDYHYLYAELEIVDEIEQWVVKLDEIAKGNAISEKEKVEQGNILHTSYIADIDAEMMRIFGTIDRDKANALYNTWYEWLKDPSYFADKGLWDDDGLPIDTSGKVAQYAQFKVNQCKDYSVFLIQREKQFRDALAAL